MRIGICGGTFDPFHRGHLEPVLDARAAMQWDLLIFVPARQQPFKLDREAASGYHRFAMVALATAAFDGIRISPVELDRAGTSFAVDTLEQFHAEWPDATFDWVIGDDHLGELERWKSPERLFALTNFAVLARGGALPPATLTPRLSAASSRPRHGAIVMLETPLVTVSSTEIRRRVAAGLPIDDFVDPGVARYIHHNDLYLQTKKGDM